VTCLVKCSPPPASRSASSTPRGSVCWSGLIPLPMASEQSDAWPLLILDPGRARDAGMFLARCRRAAGRAPASRPLVRPGRRSTRTFARSGRREHGQADGARLGAWPVRGRRRAGRSAAALVPGLRPGRMVGLAAAHTFDADLLGLCRPVRLPTAPAGVACWERRWCRSGGLRETARAGPAVIGPALAPPGGSGWPSGLPSRAARAAGPGAPPLPHRFQGGST
jgi:hypothetical protein